MDSEAGHLEVSLAPGCGEEETMLHSQLELSSDDVTKYQYLAMEDAHSNACNCQVGLTDNLYSRYNRAGFD